MKEVWLAVMMGERSEGANTKAAVRASMVGVARPEENEKAARARRIKSR